MKLMNKNCRFCIKYEVCYYLKLARELDGEYSVDTCTDKNPNLIYDTLTNVMASECTQYLLSIKRRNKYSTITKSHKGKSK